MNEIDKKPALKHLLVVAFPMIISQGSETVMMFADRLFLAQLGKAHIAAAMNGGLSAFVFVSFFTGITGYVNAVAAQYFGAGKRKRCSQTAFQGILLSFMFYPAMLALIPAVKGLFAVAGHSEFQISLEFSYFRILMFGSILMVIRNALVGFFIGIGRTKIVMVSNILGMLVNIPLNYVLVFGKMGFPKMGIEGAALGTLGGSLVITIMLAVIYFLPRINNEFGTRRNCTFNSRLMKKLLRFGTPAGTEVFLNVFAFNIFVQLMHSYSADVAASVTIAFNWDLVAFVPMIGLGFATTALVGQYMGAGNVKGAQRITYLAIFLAFSYSGIMMLLFVIGARPLVMVFASGFSSVDGDIVPLAVIMLRLASLYTMADATQIVFTGALRGAGDTKWVMIISVILHWIMAAAAVVMIRVVHTSPIYVWIFFISFIMLLSISMFLRFKLGHWKKIKLI